MIFFTLKIGEQSFRHAISQISEALQA